MVIRVTKKCKILKSELKLGIPIEMEHTSSRKRAAHIAAQHLCEMSKYYSKGLIPMERRLRRAEYLHNSRKIKGGK